MSSRLIVLIIVFCLTSSILIGRLFYLQIVRGEDYLENYELQIRKTRTVPGTRGNIFDRNGEVIAYNELAYSVTIEDIIPTDTKTEDKNKILNESISYENNNERILELESNKYNPEVNLFNDYDYSSLRNKIIEVLTWEEELIFNLKEQNYTVLEISEITGNKLRTVYNIIKRIQDKTIKLMSN